MPEFVEVSASLTGTVRQFAFKYYIRGMEPEDLMQEFWLHLFRKYPKYDPSRAGVKTWANRLLNNYRIDLNRKSERDTLTCKMRVYANWKDPEDTLNHIVHG